MARLLVVEDDALLRSALSQSLKAAGYQVECAGNGIEALTQVSRSSFDLIISDIRMPGMDGVSAISHVKATFPNMKTILITGYSDEEPIARALNLGVNGVLKKPFAIKDLLQMISVKLEERERDKERERVHREQEDKVRNIFSRLTERLGFEKAQEFIGQELPVTLHSASDEMHKGATFAELGRAAQLRQEFEVAILAYETALETFSESKNAREELPIRLALSTLFAVKRDRDLALLHAEEALELARQLKQASFLIDALHNMSRLWIEIDLSRSLSFWEEARALLRESRSGEASDRKATSYLLEARLALTGGNFEAAKFAMREFLSFGRRHFLPSLLVAMSEIAFQPFIFALEENIHSETALWILEEVAPLLQDKLKTALQQKPHLKSALAGYIHALPFDHLTALQVFTFGKLKIFLDGKSLVESRWPSLKGRSLLLYLLHENPRMISEEHLLDLFWPHLELEKARHAFRTTLYFIRRTLDVREMRSLIYRERQKYGIRKDASYGCDFLLFRKHYQQGRLDWEQGQRDRAIFSMKQAERLYKGSFLPGWSDEWSLQAREQFQEAYVWLMMAFAGYCRQQKGWKEVLGYAKKAVSMDPTLEEAHILVMESLLELGNREQAVRQFHLCRETLHKELKVAPSDRLQRLYSKAVDSIALVRCHA